jgi:hypothetical protein
MSREILQDLGVLHKKRKYKDIVGVLEILFDNDFEQAICLLFKGNNKINKLISDRRFLEEFWNSNILSKFGVKIVQNSIYGDVLFEKYFKQGNVCQYFIMSCFDEVEDEILKYFRYNSAFLSNCHYESFLNYLSKNDKCEVIKEYKYLRSLSVKSNNIIDKYYSLIKNSTVDAIIVGFSIYSEKIYFSCESDVVFQRRRPILLSLLEDALNMKKRTTKGSGVNCPTEKNIGTERSSLLRNLELGIYPKIFSFFDELEVRAQVYFLIEMYSWQNWEIDFSTEMPFFKPSADWSMEEWKNVDRKYSYFFDYYYGHNIEDNDRAEKYSENAVDDISKRGMKNVYFSAKYLLKELGITDKVNLKKYSVDAFDCLCLAGLVTGCYESQFQHVMAEFKRDGLSYLEAIHMIFFKYDVAPRFPVEFREFKQVSENAEKSGVNDINTIKETYHLMSANLDDPFICLDGKAIIRSSSGYILLMRYFHPDLSSVFYNSILREEVNSNNSYSEFQESKIADLFRLRDLSAESSIDLCSSNGHRCEIDAAAYKDGILFIVEAKLTYLRKSQRSIIGHLPVLQKAGRQLKKSLQIIEDQYHVIAGLLNIDLPFDRLRIVPLIVSSSFEFDGHYFSGFRKVSLFELQLLLEGSAISMKYFSLTKEIMLDASENVLSDRIESGYSTREEKEIFMQQAAHIFTEELLDKIGERVKMPQISCESSVTDVVNAIESGTIWQYLLDGEEPEKSKIAPLVINGEIVALYAC